MHGGFLTLADEVRSLIADGFTPDVVLCSSMMDVAAFAGALRAELESVPIVTYFHESQFTYPLSPADKVDFTYQMKNWASAATADLVIFNSVFHRDVFRKEARAFLRSFPDHRHSDMVDAVLDESIVLPVGIDLRPFEGERVARSGPPLVVWNQRWEHDKGPAELKAIVERLLDSDIEFSMAMCGEVFVSVPPMFAEVTSMLGPHLVHAGFADRSQYVELLRSASVVLSTADQEFFGIGVVEAIAAGARPVLPNRLVYPERVEAIGADPEQVLFDGPRHAVTLIEQQLALPEDSAIRSAAMQYDWSVVAPRYDKALSGVL